MNNLVKLSDTYDVGRYFHKVSKSYHLRPWVYLYLRKLRSSNDIISLTDFYVDISTDLTNRLNVNFWFIVPIRV